MKKVIVLFFSFYILALLQVSFFIFFPIKNYIFSPILIAVILINLLEKPTEKIGLVAAVLGGFFLDFFSERFFSYWVLIFLIISICIKFFLKRYVRNPLYR